MKEPQSRPPPFATIMNRRSQEVGGMLMDSGIGKFVMIPKFQTCRPIALRKPGEPLEHAVALVAATVLPFEFEFVIDV